MQRIILTIALLFIIVEANSQSIVVKGFHKIESDQDARIAYPKTDQNGKKCALIKVVTSQIGFVFDFGLIGNAVATEQHTGELWIWVPAGARKVTISHQQLGVLRNYPFDIDIEEATVYEMVLTTGKVTTIVEEQIASQWLVINSTPSGADISIDDQFANQTPYQSELPLGKHTYRLSHDLYLPTAGSVILTADKKETLNLELKPDFGTLNVTTTPEKGAAVSLDGQATGKTTPCTLEQIKSGEHSVTLRLNMYKTTTEKVTLQPGDKKDLQVTLTPTFGEVTVTTNPPADIYIAGEQKGNGTWTGRLSPGLYQFEARKEKYTTAIEKHEVITGQPLNLTLQPVAKNGILKVMTTPTDATIMLDGVNKGTSPTTIRNLLVGDYALTISMPGYATITKSITVTEGQTTQVSETLINCRSITINSTPSGVVLSVDGNVVGQTPYSGSLTFGSHTLQIEQGGKKSEKTITINQTGGETSFTMSFGPESFTDKVNGVNIEMVAIKGGTFQMGSPESEVDRFSSETLHQVIVSDFYIGKYEVTQAQWKAVMDNNPSNFKGDDLPVEEVSWNDVQEFLQKLNAKTGKTYRLPTEAEWEYACRAGTTTPFNTGNNLTTSQANYNGTYPYNNNEKGDYRGKTMPVGSFPPNAWGLYDMHGNVWEWCNDRFDSGYYNNSPQTNPVGPSSGSDRVRRGGSWFHFAQLCRSARRINRTLGNRDSDIGFRLCSSK